jgi:hypothetical protein
MVGSVKEVIEVIRRQKLNTQEYSKEPPEAEARDS